jgi:hypothetical protein
MSSNNGRPSMQSSNNNRRRNVVSCVTVGDSDEEHRSPMKNRGSSIQQGCHQPNSGSAHCSNGTQMHNVDHQQHQHGGNVNNNGHHGLNTNGSGGVGGAGSSNSIKNTTNAVLRDVKPELITSYASQKKRLLAKAQSECLIGLKQEPGLVIDHSNAGLNHHVENSTPKSIKGGQSRYNQS